MRAELASAGATDEEIDRITWQNACRSFDWDLFSHVPRAQASAGARSALATDVDVSIRSRAEWIRVNGERRSVPAGRASATDVQRPAVSRS